MHHLVVISRVYRKTEKQIKDAPTPDGQNYDVALYFLYTHCLLTCTLKNPLDGTILSSATNISRHNPPLQLHSSMF